MQLYDGLPIITNKITTEEQKGIPHHLLGQISLKEDSWHVDNFKREATKVAAIPLNKHCASKWPTRYAAGATCQS